MRGLSVEKITLGLLDYLVVLAIALITMGYCGVQIVRLLRLRRDYRLGYEGEVATGQ